MKNSKQTSPVRSVWDHLEDDPATAQSLKLRSSLMIALQEHIRRSGYTHKRAAELLGVTQPRISDLMRGRIELFAIDTLVNMLALAGLRVELSITEAA